MKKEYKNPTLKVVTIQPANFIANSPGSRTYTDEPQEIGNALSNRSRYSTWEEDDEE